MARNLIISFVIIYFEKKNALRLIAEIIIGRLAYAS